jgi:hypothetical protein
MFVFWDTDTTFFPDFSPKRIELAKATIPILAAHLRSSLLQARSRFLKTLLCNFTPSTLL